MNLNKLKVATIVGTRPEIIKLAETIKACDTHFDHTLIHTGQNWDYSLNEVFFEDFNIRKPDFFLDSVGVSLGSTVGNIISKSYELLSNHTPEAILILGDTNSALAAISAKRLKIPIFHMEAGNRCFDENLPEEINRKIVDHISDVNLPYSSNAKQNLLNEGIKVEYTFVTGSPMNEIIQNNINKIRSSLVLDKLGLNKKQYILVSAHREENVDNEVNFKSLTNSLNKIAKKYDMPMIFSVHPRTKQRLEKNSIKLHKNIKLLEPFGYFDYNKLQLDSFCVLSDSGTLAEESSILGFSGVSLRTSTERQEAIDTGSFVIGGITEKSITQSIELCREMTNKKNKICVPIDYSSDNVSQKIIKIIQSYTPIINDKIWNKKND